MNTEIRIDLQAEGMGASGHKWLFTTEEDNSWETVEVWGCALAAVYDRPVEVTMTEFFVNYTESNSMYRGIRYQRFLGRFVPYGFAPRAAKFIDHTIYEEVE